MPRPATQTRSFWQHLVLVVSAPVVFLPMSESAVRVGAIDTDVARNHNFQIGVPVWLLDDDASWRGHLRSAVYRFETFRLLRRVILTAYDSFDASQARAQSEGNER